MLDAFKRLFAKSSPTPHAWDDVERWAGTRQVQFRAARDEEGFIVDGRSKAVQWRLEWGPPQRDYVKGRELRMRAELPLPGEVQALVLDRVLQASMERAVFEQYVEGVQTRIDNQTPPEMRWLVMFPKIANEDLGALREHYAAVAPGRSWIRAWFEGGLTETLLAAPRVGAQPLVLMVARARLTLRTALDQPTPQALDAWVAFFEAALRSVPRDLVTDADSSLTSTRPGLFNAAPDDEAPPR